jgi:MFS family permease
VNRFFYLLNTRRFAPIFTTSLLGALNDNILKNTLVILVVFQASSWTTLDSAIIAPLIGTLFILPFFLFSGLAGELCDTLDKAAIARAVKLLEIFLMGLATIGFTLHSFTLLAFIVFGMGLHSTFFGPLKYSILPQHLHDNELVSANTLMESGTFIAILMGAILGGFFGQISHGGSIAGLIGTSIAIIGYIASRSIPGASSEIPKTPIGFTIFTQTARAIGYASSNRIRFFSILGISWFWLYGALFLTYFPTIVNTILHANESIVTLFLTLFSIGIAIGSIAYAFLSHHSVKLSLMVAGAIGMGIFGMDFTYCIATYQNTIGHFENIIFYRLLLDTVLIGLSGGAFSVPLYTIIQRNCDDTIRSRVIAANNIFNALFMVVGSLLCMIAIHFGATVAHILGTLSLATLSLSLIVSRHPSTFNKTL